MIYPAPDSFFNFDVKRLTNNVNDGRLMGSVITAYKDSVIALFIIPSPDPENNPSDDQHLQLIARNQVNNLRSKSFASLVQDRPDIERKYYNYALLLGDRITPGKHTLIVSANTRYLTPTLFAENNWADIEKARANEGQIPVLSLLMNCPKANLVFLENLPDWNDTTKLKKAFAFGVSYEIESHYNCFWFESTRDDDDEDWFTDY